jgi:pseudomonalisin
MTRTGGSGPIAPPAPPVGVIAPAPIYSSPLQVGAYELVENLIQGSSLTSGSRIRSLGSTHALVNNVVSHDLELYNTKTGQLIWSAGVARFPTPTPNTVTLEYSGSLVIFDLGPTAGNVWNTPTNYNGINERLAVQDDGNLVIYQPASAVWSTGTNVPGYATNFNAYASNPAPHDNSGYWSPGRFLQAGESVTSSGGQYKFTMQSDGNLVLYKGTTATWNSHTQGHPGAYATMQTDGNLVVYIGNVSNATALWSSGTEGHPGASLLLQDDGNAVIYTWKAAWASNTYGQ